MDKLGQEIPGRLRTVLINAWINAGDAESAMKLLHSRMGISYERTRSIKKRVNCVFSLKAEPFMAKYRKELNFCPPNIMTGIP